jgi:hypothetical protein
VKLETQEQNEQILWKVKIIYSAESTKLVRMANRAPSVVTTFIYKKTAIGRIVCPTCNNLQYGTLLTYIVWKRTRKTKAEAQLTSPQPRARAKRVGANLSSGLRDREG